MNPHDDYELSGWGMVVCLAVVFIVAWLLVIGCVLGLVRLIQPMLPW